MTSGSGPDLKQGFAVRHILRCPQCAGNLDWSQDQGRCLICSKTYPVVNNIYDMRVGEQNRPKLYSDSSYVKFASALEAIHARYYSESSASSGLEIRFRHSLATLITTPPDFIVDLGCGTGSGFHSLGDPSRIVGVDVDLRLLLECRKTYPNVALVCCDLNQSPFRDECVPAISSMASLEHVFWMEATLDAMERMLTTDGRAYVMAPTEGGLAWTLARRLFTVPTYSKICGLSSRQYIRAARISHCNTVFAIDSALRKFFDVDTSHYWPFCIGGPQVNLVKCWRLRKLT